MWWHRRAVAVVECFGGIGFRRRSIIVFWRMWCFTAVVLNLGLYRRQGRSIGGGSLSYGGHDQSDGGREDGLVLLSHCSNNLFWVAFLATVASSRVDLGLALFLVLRGDRWKF